MPYYQITFCNQYCFLLDSALLLLGSRKSFQVYLHQNYWADSVLHCSTKLHEPCTFNYSSLQTLDIC